MRALALLAILVLAAPTAAAALPQGCTQPGLVVYGCTQEEPSECGGFTAIGAGVTATAGAAIAGFEGCGSRTLIVTASASAVFVNLHWQDDASGCHMFVFATGAGFSDLPCVAGAPPEAGWGNVLP